MRGDGVRSDQMSRLLRVGLGAVWVYEGLVPKLLLPQPALVSLLADRLPVGADPILLLRLVGAAEVALGLAIVLGWRLRMVAALQTVGIALLTVAAAIALPQALTASGGALGKNAALCAAGCCLWVLAGPQQDASASRRADLLSLLLRAGLGIAWLYAGVVSSWLAPGPAQAAVVGRAGSLMAPLPALWHWLGLLEVALGVALLVGLWVRELAAVQVATLLMLTVLVASTSPRSLTDPLGRLSKNLGLIAAALGQYLLGGGRWSLEEWLLRRAWIRRWLVVTGLSHGRLQALAMQHLYAMQGQAAGDVRLRDVLVRLEREEGSRAADLDHLARRHGRSWIPCGLLAWGIGGGAGFVTVILGTRASLVFALWLERRGVMRAEGIAALLPSDDGISVRALRAIQHQDELHVELLQEQLRRLRSVRPGRGRR
jgi:uncharacterized membrane protein YphA (DoxX/SURF4 family)